MTADSTTEPSAAPSTEPGARSSLFAPKYLWTTIGSNALVFLGAFEALAVTTVMPVVSRELDGQSLYSVAFSGMLAASVVGMVVAGLWADRKGPTGPLVASVLTFTLGLLVAGFAASMEVFIVGRLLQGLGAGAMNVALYVIVARIYPGSLHPRIFGMFAAAWVLPSLVGPPIAGAIADIFSWHWVFLGVAVLVVASAAAVLPVLRQLRAGQPVDVAAPGNSWTLLWAAVVAVGVLAISIGGESGGALAWPIAIAAFVVVVLALRPLVPRGTLAARSGLPATILMRGAVAATFYAAEIYLPLLFVEKYALSTPVAGLILTVGAVSWASGSAIQSRIGERMSHSSVIVLGAVLLSVGIAVQALTALLLLSPLVAAGGWLVAGGGMGLVFPRISTLVLGFSTEKNQGFNSAAMSIADSVGGATAIAFSGLLFTAAIPLGGTAPFIAALGLTAVLALASVFVGLRIRGRELIPVARPVGE